MIVAIGMLYTSQLYFGTVDIGQEFGVLGDYNRVKSARGGGGARTQLPGFVGVCISIFTLRYLGSGYRPKRFGKTAVISFESGMSILEESSREELERR